MSSISAVMKTAGWAIRSGDDEHHLRESLTPIFQLLSKLRKAIGEDIISVDLELVGINSGDIFDPSCMENAHPETGTYWDERQPEAATVTGTVGLGLLRTATQRSMTGRVRRQRDLVSKPRVVLEGSIQEILGPPPQDGASLDDETPFILQMARSEMSLRRRVNADELRWVYV